MAELILGTESDEIMGACFEVYKEKGCGFLADVYQECLELEFADQGIPFEPQQEHPLTDKGRPLSKTYKSDFWCFDQVIVEIKAVDKLADIHRSQVLNYLRATAARLGLLVNFGYSPKPEWERIVR